MSIPLEASWLCKNKWGESGGAPIAVMLHACLVHTILSREKTACPSVLVQCMSMFIFCMNEYEYDCDELNMDIFVKHVGDSNCVNFYVWE